MVSLFKGQKISEQFFCPSIIPKEKQNRTKKSFSLFA
jgi:hypothetical protein